MKEIWKICPIAPEYEVSTLGRIRWTDSKKWGSIFTVNGYQAINRSVKYTDTPNQVKLYVHQLIARTFVDGYKEGYVVNHIDGCKTNNWADNLEWVNRRANITDCYNPHKVYTQDIIDAMYEDYRSGMYQKAIGIKYHMQQAYVSQLLYNNLSSRDIEPIRYLYNNNYYSIVELSSIYNVDSKVIKNIVDKL